MSRAPNRLPAFLALAVVLSAGDGDTALAQRNGANVGVPFGAGNDAFFERFGVNMQLNGRGFFFNLGGFNNAIPQFGGFQPGAGAAGGLGFGGNGVNGQVGFDFSQGSRRSNVSQSVSGTLMNGQGLVVSDTSQSPFVVNVGPPPLLARPGAEGGGLPWKQQLEGHVPKQESSGASPPQEPRAAAAASPRPASDNPIRSVAEIRRERQAQQVTNDDEARRNFARGRQAEEDGKPGVARIYYRLAVEKAAGELREEVLQRLRALD